MPGLDTNSTTVLLAFLGVANTAMLVYQAVKLNQVHRSVNGALDLTNQVAENTGFMRGIQAIAPVPPASPPVGPPIKPPAVQ